MGPISDIYEGGVALCCIEPYVEWFAFEIGVMDPVADIHRLGVHCVVMSLM
jgi:hypothetical protein